MNICFIRFGIINWIFPYGVIQQKWCRNNLFVITNQKRIYTRNGFFKTRLYLTAMDLKVIVIVYRRYWLSLLSLVWLKLSCESYLYFRGTQLIPQPRQEQSRWSWIMTKVTMAEYNSAPKQLNAEQWVMSVLWCVVESLLIINNVNWRLCPCLVLFVKATTLSC